MNEQVLGLIAGSGRLPFMVARGARKAGLRVICVGLSGSVDPQLAEETDVFSLGAVARPAGWIKKLRAHGVTSTVMVGAVEKTRILTANRILNYLPDWRAFRIWYGRLAGTDKRNDTVLCAIADELATGQIILEDSTLYCKEYLAQAGVMAAVEPDPIITGDIEFGWHIVKKLGDLDIGQAIAVREKEVIAVEAIEGTAKMIERAGRLCAKGGWTLIKTAKPNQDMRFDVPCVGPDTIESLHKNGGRCLVVEKGKTILIEKEKMLQLADRYGISVFGH